MQGQPINDGFGIPGLGPVSDWLLVLGIALFIDILIGQRLTNLRSRLSFAFFSIAEFFEKRLNKTGRSNTDLMIRGAIVTLVTGTAVIAAGFTINIVLPNFPLWVIPSGVLLCPLVGQKEIWASVTEPVESPTKPDETHKILQARALALVTRFGTIAIPRLLIFAFSGFAGLALMVMLDALLIDTDTHAAKPGPYFTLSRFLYSLLSLPGAILASFTLLLARFFLPETRLNPLKGIGPNRSKLPPNHYWPVNIVAYGLHLSFKLTQLCYKKRQLKREAVWIGPNDGTARLTILQLKRVWYMVLAANSLCLLLGFMLYTALTVTG